MCTSKLLKKGKGFFAFLAVALFVAGASFMSAEFFKDYGSEALESSAINFLAQATPTLKGLSLVKQSRLSVCPVSSQEWAEIMELAETAL